MLRDVTDGLFDYVGRRQQVIGCGNLAVVLWSVWNIFIQVIFFWQWGRKLIKKDSEPTVFSFALATGWKPPMNRNNSVCWTQCWTSIVYGYGILNILVIGLWKHSAPTCRYQAGNWSRLVAVVDNWSGMRYTCHSGTSLQWLSANMCLLCDNL